MNLFSPFAMAIYTIAGLGLLGLPIGYSMIAGSILYLLLAGLDLATTAEQVLNGLMSSYVLLAVPLFLFSAELMNLSKMTDHLLGFCDMLVGRFKGGLGHINVVQSIIFSGMSGSAIADLAGTGKISIDMMTKNNRYPVSYAAAITAASAVIGPIIPPSIPMVVYALISDTSVGYLFIGGVIPGFLMAFAQMGVNSYMAHKHELPGREADPDPRMARDHLESNARTADAGDSAWRHLRWRGDADGSRRGCGRLCLYRRHLLVPELRLARDTRGDSGTSARQTASIGMLIAGALAFNYVVTVEQIPLFVEGLLAGYDLSPGWFLFWVNVVLLLLGCVLEGTTIMLVIVPVFIPTAEALGIDLVHFGKVVVVNIMIGLITPPYGLLLFIVSSISGAPLRRHHARDAFRSCGR